MQKWDRIALALLIVGMVVLVFVGLLIPWLLK
jgi:hypothetical protein